MSSTSFFGVYIKPQKQKKNGGLTSTDFFMIDSYRQEIEIKSGGRNTVIYDDYNNPNIIVCLPKIDIKDYGIENLSGVFPTFNVEGKDVEEIWISKYPNTVSNGGVPCSLPDTW